MRGSTWIAMGTCVAALAGCSESSGNESPDHDGGHVLGAGGVGGASSSAAGAAGANAGATGTGASGAGAAPGGAGAPPGGGGAGGTMPGSGGASGSGGATAAGGSTAACTQPLSARIRVSSVETGAGLVAGDEYHPVLVTPRPAGGSLLAWRLASGETIRVVRLDASDALEGTTLFDFTGREVHAALGSDVGGLLVIVADDPDIYSPKYCVSSATPNAGGYCQKVDLVRFDDAGQTTWRTTLTDKTNVDADGALFVWWYQHTARLVEGGNRYGVYFRSAGSSPRPGVPDEIDIHAGDTLRFVDPDGKVSGGGWDWGCSHSWAVRLSYGARFGAACHGDAYPNALRLAVLDPVAGSNVDTHEFLPGTDPTGRALGDLVPAVGGFWLTYVASDAGGQRLHLAHVDAAAGVTSDVVVDAATNLDATYPFRAYLARYGNDRLLLGWKSGGTLQLAVADATTGAVVEGPVAAGGPIDEFTDFVTDAGGDVIWANADGGSSVVQVTRVMDCE